MDLLQRSSPEQDAPRHEVEPAMGGTRSGAGERLAAASQIHRSLQAWRSASGEGETESDDAGHGDTPAAAEGKVEAGGAAEPKEGDAIEDGDKEESEEAPEKPSLASKLQRLARKVHRSPNGDAKSVKRKIFLARDFSRFDQAMQTRLSRFDAVLPENRTPVRRARGPMDFEYLDPAAQGMNQIGFCKMRDGFLEASILPMRIQVQGAMLPTFDARARLHIPGQVILDMMVADMQAALRAANPEAFAQLQSNISQLQGLQGEQASNRFQLNGFRAHWVESTFGDPATNLIKFNENKAAGMDDDTAAKNTWTGPQLERLFGYTKVKVTNKVLKPHSTNQYADVTAEFTKE